MKKILVIGTSNSLVKNGWVTGLNLVDGLEVVNLSIGGCCAMQHIERMLSHQKKIIESDVIILDSLVNDVMFDMSEQVSRKLLLESITAMYEIAASSGKYVLSILFPTQHHLGKIGNNPVYLHHIQETAKLNIGCIDLYEICKNLPYKALGFLDGPHISPFFARFMGESIGRYCINQLPFISTEEKNIKKNVSGYQYRVLDLTLHCKKYGISDVENKKNSLFSEPLIRLTNNLELSLEGCELLGLLQWSDKGSSSIKCQSKSSVIKVDSSAGLFRFSSMYEPFKIDQTLSLCLDSDEYGSLSYISKLLLRIKSDSEDVANAPLLDLAMLEFEIRRSFALYVAGINASAYKIKTSYLNSNNSDFAILEKLLEE